MADLQADARLSTRALRKVLAPFVGYRLEIGPKTRAVDILHSCGMALRADVRSVTEQGVSVFFYDHLETIAWADILEVTVSALDAKGNRTSSVTYDHALPAQIREAA
jgi:hypothetical protein